MNDLQTLIAVACLAFIAALVPLLIYAVLRRNKALAEKNQAEAEVARLNAELRDLEAQYRANLLKVNHLRSMKGRP